MITFWFSSLWLVRFMVHFEFLLWIFEGDSIKNQDWVFLGKGVSFFFFSFFLSLPAFLLRFVFIIGADSPDWFRLNYFLMFIVLFYFHWSFFFLFNLEKSWIYMMPTLFSLLSVSVPVNYAVCLFGCVWVCLGLSGMLVHWSDFEFKFRKEDEFDYDGMRSVIFRLGD